MPKVYEHIIQQTLLGCDGVANISDDILVHGKTREEHDTMLKAVLERIRERGLTLN